MQDDDSRINFQRIGRWYYMSRYYRVSQLIRRGCKELTKKLSRVTGFVRSLPTAHDICVRESTLMGQLAAVKIAARQNDSLETRVEAMRAGRFAFLDVEADLDWNVDWHSDDLGRMPQLWRFQFHYHEFLLDLLAAHQLSGDSSLTEDAWRFVDRWISQHPYGEPRFFEDAWHPYCISRRLPVWILLSSRSLDTIRSVKRVLESIFEQASYLCRHLERDVRGNHLLENARALLMAGSFLKGRAATQWFRTGESVLRNEVREQILPSGEHFERSPMYHVQVMELLLDVAQCCQDSNPDLTEFCQNAAGRMAGFLPQILHPDGEIPLLSDSCLGESAPAGLVMRRAANQLGSGEIGLVAATDYWTFRDGGDFLLFDRGKVGVDHLPAHAHCDLLNIEASLAGRRFIVDSGVFNYEDDEMRQYCRSTAAHNVLEVDGVNQCDVWSRFRMGYRGWPDELNEGCEAGFHWASCRHNAYRRLGVPKVSRWIACRIGGPWFIVDSARGKGRHRLVSRLHLHPDCVVEQVDLISVTVLLGDQQIRVSSLGEGDLTIDEGWYCPAFGRRQAARVLSWTSESELPFVCGWAIAWREKGSVAILDNTRLTWRDHHGEVVLHPVVV